jgi:very-short-patch-repair endonuclease
MNSSRLSPPDERIGELSRWQGGHVTRRQLLALGVDDNAIAYRARVGRLIRVHHGVYAVGHLPTTPIDQARGALLAAGGRSALAGRTALALWRAERTWPEPFELISPRDVRLATVNVHRSKTLLRRDIRTVQGLRVTSPARTALDLAAHLKTNELTSVVNDLRVVNKLKVHQLRDIVNRNPRHPGTTNLTELLGDSQRQPTRSELENAFRRLIKRHNLPTPLINTQVGGEEVDAYFPDHELIVELDGGPAHADDWRPAFEGDRARVVDVMAKTGIPTIRFTWDQTTRRHKQTAARLKTILERRAQRLTATDPRSRASRGAPQA